MHFVILALHILYTTQNTVNRQAEKMGVIIVPYYYRLDRAKTQLSRYLM